MSKACASRDGCENWVTGGLSLNFERDAADGRVLQLRARGGYPARWAVSQSFVSKLTKEIPGAAEWVNGRLIIRTGQKEHAYRKSGTCSGCGYVLVTYEGAG